MKRLFRGLAWAGRLFAGAVFRGAGSSSPAEPERVSLTAGYAPRAELVATDSSRTSLTARGPT